MTFDNISANIGSIISLAEFDGDINVYNTLIRNILDPRTTSLFDIRSTIFFASNLNISNSKGVIFDATNTILNMEYVVIQHISCTNIAEGACIIHSEDNKGFHLNEIAIFDVHTQTNLIYISNAALAEINALNILRVNTHSMGTTRLLTTSATPENQTSSSLFTIKIENSNTLFSNFQLYWLQISGIHSIASNFVLKSSMFNNFDESKDVSFLFIEDSNSSIANATFVQNAILNSSQQGVRFSGKIIKIIPRLLFLLLKRAQQTFLTYYPIPHF